MNTTKCMDIRISRDDSVKLIKRGILTRDHIIGENDYIEVNQIPFAFAKRIINWSDIEVQYGNGWVFIKTCDEKALMDIYERDLPMEAEETDQIFIIDNETTEEVVEETFEEEPTIIETTEEPVEENIVEYIEESNMEETDQIFIIDNETTEEVVEETEVVVEEESISNEIDDEEKYHQHKGQPIPVRKKKY